MVLVYLEFGSDFMEVFYRGYLAKTLIEKSCPALGEIQFWTSNNRGIKIDRDGQRVQINDGEFIPYDLLWIGSPGGILFDGILAPELHFNPGRYPEILQ